MIKRMIIGKGTNGSRLPFCRMAERCPWRNQRATAIMKHMRIVYMTSLGLSLQISLISHPDLVMSDQVSWLGGHRDDVYYLRNVREQ